MLNSTIQSVPVKKTSERLGDDFKRSSVRQNVCLTKCSHLFGIPNNITFLTNFVEFILNQFRPGEKIQGKREKKEKKGKKRGRKRKKNYIKRRRNIIILLY